MNSMQRKTDSARDFRRRFPVASAREGAPAGRRRGIFCGRRVARTEKESAMEPVLNPRLFDESETSPGAVVETGQRVETRSPRRSHAAEYIAALYIALLVCTPWLVRDASFFRPPSTGIEMHLSAAAPAPVDVLPRSPQATR